jgi:hypothetical protein
MITFRERSTASKMLCAHSGDGMAGSNSSGFVRMMLSRSLRDAEVAAGLAG